MASMRIPALVASALLALLSSACNNSRPASPGGSESSTETCVYCHGTVGRIGNLPGTDPLLPSAPPSAPNGKPAAVVGAHQVHLNPPINGPFRGPIACNECHVVPQSLGHATNPPANPVQFGVLARAQGASPTYEPVGLGCAAVYCHGNFDYNGVKGKAASVVWNGGAVGCEDCHDLPPAGHPPLSGAVTPATCNGCHPYTVNASGTINLGSGAHINGRSEVSGNPHTGDPQWVDRTHHGYQASSQGMAACTSCHANFDGPSGTAAGSCNACHAAAGFATWQTNCTFCHGTASRTATALNPQLPAAPPVDSAGNGDTAPRARGVGAHSKHLVSPTISSAFACGNCHSSSLPTNVTHVDGQRAVLPFGLIAVTGSVNPHFDTATLSCSTVYCHGAFGTVGQTTAAPVWTSTTPMTCTSCHKMPTSSTGRHSLHMGQNGMNCSTCHNGIAAGTGDPSTNATITGPSLHVNGQRNVAFGGTFEGSTVSGTYSGGNCTISCHGRESW